MLTSPSNLSLCNRPDRQPIQRELIVTLAANGEVEFHRLWFDCATVAQVVHGYEGETVPTG
jgi:hypothetical protein